MRAGRKADRNSSLPAFSAEHGGIASAGVNHAAGHARNGESALLRFEGHGFAPGINDATATGAIMVMASGRTVAEQPAGEGRASSWLEGKG